jgi:hypothetical protein
LAWVLIHICSLNSSQGVNHAIIEQNWHFIRLCLLVSQEPLNFFVCLVGWFCVCVKGYKITGSYVRFEVLRATSMKVAAFWDVALCSLEDIDQRS